MILFKYLTALFFIFLVGQSIGQFNGEYYAYTQNDLSKKEIRDQVQNIVHEIDSIKATTAIPLKFRIELCVYYSSLNDQSKKWDKLKNSFYKELKKKIGSSNVVILPNSEIKPNFTTKRTHLFVGPIFY